MNMYEKPHLYKKGGEWRIAERGHGCPMHAYMMAVHYCLWHNREGR